MTNTSPPPPYEPGPTDAQEPAGQQGPRTSRNEVLELGRLRRAVDDRHIAGVGGGLARHLDIDPIIVRVALVVLVFFGGAGLLLYGAVWLLAPEEGSPAQPLGLDDRNRNIALLGAGVLAAIAAVGDFAGAFWFPWPLVIVGLLVVWFLNRKQERSQRPTSYSSPTPPWQSQAFAQSQAVRTEAGTTAEEPATGESPSGGHQAPYQPYQGYGSTQTYEQTYQGWQPPQAQTYVKPRNPRRRGPILFWFTLALIATGIGTLGLIDVSGTAVPAAAYPALAMALTGAMLLLGAFWGRAGGLIFIGLLTVLATLVGTASDNFESERVLHTPTSSSQVRDAYDFGAGEFTVDLSGVTDVEGLDDREITIDAGIGDVEVVVPEGMDVTVDASTGVGDVAVFGRSSDGLDVSQQGSVDGGDQVPDMNIIIDLGVGQVTVREK
ncbi:PspC domain-containing protein [Nocardioides currus]|uniref:Phage shock protein PspC N-terminal domain-containing protein n=1 Tax=Nocardioides currus TaxID=2133958 RepID=A0A2R7YZN0_9ACTN|nr:PspC domain-containing protein [Nocardioides currus]PUA81820.1 hypothetical protein C7S10_07095 [Nocardioides currus]